MAECERCARPQVDTGYVCHDCAAVVRAMLASVGQVAGEATVTIARLDRHGDGGHTSAEKPLPFDWDASDAEWAAHNTITTWARHVCEQRGIDPPQRPAGHADHPTARAAAWLADHLGWLRMRREATEAFDELADAVSLLRRTVDNPGVRWYAGPCRVDLDGAECDGELYARPGAAWVGCPACGTRHDADERRAWLLREARDQLLHAGWMAAALSALGEEVTAAQIRSYAHRGRILAHGVDERGRPTYRVGDVLDLITRVAA